METQYKQGCTGIHYGPSESHALICAECAHVSEATNFDYNSVIPASILHYLQGQQFTLAFKT